MGRDSRRGRCLSIRVDVRYAPGRVMRLATWNVNGLRARLEFVLHWLRERRPDVVGLQELKLSDEQFPHEAFESAGYHAVTHGQKAWNGVAIVAREKPVVTERGLPGQESMGARFLTARLGELSFTTIYCPNGKHVGHDDFPRKLSWLSTLATHFREQHVASGDLLLCGDFNLCPGPLDSWDEDRFAGTIFHTEDERARFRRLLDWGFRDAFRQIHPEERKFSWWDYRGGAFHRGLGLRIDFLLATDSVMQRVRAVEIDREYRKKKDGLIASDHAPVMLDLDGPG